MTQSDRPHSAPPDVTDGINLADIARLQASPVEQLRALTPVHEGIADEIGSLTEPQRIALAIQLIRDIDDVVSVGGLNRLMRLAEAIQTELLKRQFGLGTS